MFVSGRGGVGLEVIVIHGRGLGAMGIPVNEMFSLCVCHWH